jgi:hypothetical protein
MEMPKPSNDALVQRHRELRTTLINKHSKLAVQRIVRLWESKKKPTVEEIAGLIATEFGLNPPENECPVVVQFGTEKVRKTSRNSPNNGNSTE